jgi:very-short-patch-repair endonuclease
MRGQINTAIALRANRRKGLVTREELLAAGLTPGQIDARVRSKQLFPEYEGIYRVGHCAPNLETSYLAAVLACGKGALLSGSAAAYLYGLIKGAAAKPEVTTPTQRRPPGVICHRTRRVTDASSYRGIPVTSVARAVVDLAAQSTSGELAELFHHAVVKFRVTPHHVEAVLERRPNAKGAKNLRRVMNGDERALLSVLERAFVALLEAHDLPLPETNIPKDGHWVDCYWPDYKLTVELDTYRYHSTRHAWEQDHRRERKGRRRGAYRRYVWGDVFERPEETIADLRELLFATS